MDKQTCATCRWGIHHPRTEMRDCPGMTASNEQVECRRYPATAAKPSYGLSGGFRNPFPCMKPDDWCGEHQPKEPTPSKEGGDV